ncbi:MAG: hypothetical protein PVF74_15385 [Anaerolineales bacterium]|jgi:hypothetical protein
MDKTDRKILSERLLLAFIGFSVLMILVIWGNNLVQREKIQPDYYRETFQYDMDSIWFTETAIAEQYLLEHGVTPTPAPTREHQGNGPGGGGKRGHEGEAATLTP